MFFSSEEQFLLRSEYFQTLISNSNNEGGVYVSLATGVGSTYFLQGLQTLEVLMV